MNRHSMAVPLALLLVVTAISGCLGLGDDGSSTESKLFPDFQTEAENGENISLDDYKGAPFVVVFSAEWCTLPCFQSIHALNSSLQGPLAIVISTDPAENPQGITLIEWKESADRFDDVRNESTGEIIDAHQTLDYRFIKGSEIATALGIQSPGTVVFLNAETEVVAEHIGVLEEPTTIIGYWEKAGGTVSA
uniref:Thiol-disulfide isomerase family protein n=1 Tax=uncultured marine group II/III euryarchaeote KM3_178_D06 TaxID=1457940 RepID=A0A075GMB3_9EURY|nr:Thiol-disulfide isomerase family protein [uncultured marine group II/III euryarchaeote KM3_178_D06]